MKIKEKIQSICKEYDFEKYQNIDLNSLVVFVIDILNKNGVPLSFENICAATYLMFPKKFSLLGFDEYPDATRINRALLQLRPKYQNLATGDVKSGFSLTEKGKMRVNKAEFYLSKTNEKKVYKDTRPKSEEKIINELKESIAYKKFEANKLDEIQIEDIYGFLQATPYTSKENIRKHLNMMIDIANERGDKKIVEFIKSVKNKFSKLFKN